MIYYFSGTGNSLHVARHLADALGERLSPMVTPGATQDEAIGLVFPVYAWSIPQVVEAFIRRGPLQTAPKGSYIYAVMTCGDDMGYADKELDKALQSAMGRKFDAVFSVQMPNVYVCLPGFDVDSSKVCKEKYAREEKVVKEVAASVKAKEAVRRFKRGVFPWTKTYVIRPLFNRYLLTDKYFQVDASRCIACGRCRKSCPVGNIIIDEVPKWQSHCAGCLACYHACPYHAINFGKMTQKKGQYNLMKQLYANP